MVRRYGNSPDFLKREEAITAQENRAAVSKVQAFCVQQTATAKRKFTGPVETVRAEKRGAKEQQEVNRREAILASIPEG